MSELTKFVAEIAIITLKNVSNALLQTASEIRKLNNDSEPLSQAEQKPNFVSLKAPELTKREQYKVGDRVLVSFDPRFHRSLMTILEVLEDSQYMAYHWKAPKDTAQKINQSQIAGLDPNR
jgi:hypothetical protein